MGIIPHRRLRRLFYHFKVQTSYDTLEVMSQSLPTYGLFFHVAWRFGAIRDGMCRLFLDLLDMDLGLRAVKLL
jgi:hypothetical protein